MTARANSKAKTHGGPPGQPPKRETAGARLLMNQEEALGADMRGWSGRCIRLGGVLGN
jgi:hypothetical protein